MKAISCLVIACILAVAIAGPQPKFPTDWTALEDDELNVQQGQVTQVGNLLCCNIKSNCQVQVQYQLGNVYVDVTNQRSRFDDRISGQIIVDLFDIQKTMLVVNMTCKEYCPMQGEVLTPGFLDPNATDKGQVTLPDGRKAEHWQWKDTIFGIIVMEINDVYVNQTDMQNATPLGQIQHLTPFGQHIGDFVSNWNDFRGGTPDPALFKVQGVDTCPMSPNCQQQSLQAHRLRTRQMKTFLKYHQDAKLEQGFE